MSRYRRTELILSFVCASVLEAGSLVAMFSTMGHAGPEGPFGFIGWLSTMLNFPGLFGAAILGVSTEPSILKLVATVFALQMPFVWAVTFLALSFFNSRRRVRSPSRPEEVSGSQPFHNRLP